MGAILNCNSAFETIKTSEENLSFEQQTHLTVEEKAQKILEARCNSCHGPESPVYKDINFISDSSKLVSSGLVIPFSSKESPLYIIVSSLDIPNPMPLSGRLNQAEIDLIGNWIDSGAAAFPDKSDNDLPIARSKEENIPQALILEAIKKDLGLIKPEDRQFYRYLSLSHLKNQIQASQIVDSLVKAINKLLNSLSWEKEISLVESLENDLYIYRIDLRKYGWSSANWEDLVNEYNYRVNYSVDLNSFDIALGAEYNLLGEIQTQIGTGTPVLRGDWFAYSAAWPFLYNKLLKLPSTLNELEKNLLNIDIDKNIMEQKVVRAGFVNSNVSFSNRLIERSETQYGAYWKSYDFVDNVGDHNLKEFPVGPTPLFLREDGGFSYNGSEIIFNLPNGLQAYVLADSEGTVIETAPTTIVQDPIQQDKIVRNGVSCIMCHATGMNRNRDIIRKLVVGNSSFSPKVQDQVAKTHPEQSELEAIFDKDDALFARALAKMGINPQLEEPIGYASFYYNRDLDFSTVAYELGVTTEVLEAKISNSDYLSNILSRLIVTGTITRNDFVNIYSGLYKHIWK